MRFYCTYFDSAYLAHGIVMLRSLRRHDPDARLAVLTLDELAARAVRETFGPEMEVLETEELHSMFPVMRRIREERSKWAYYATQKPAMVQYVMECATKAESVFYIDADLWFTASPMPVLGEIGRASVALSQNRMSPSLQHLKIYGTYGAGCVYWRNDEVGRTCVREWLDDCIEWCAEQPLPDGRFMNQGYLNRWPERYSNVHVIQHPGMNVGPWNIDRHVLVEPGAGTRVDGHPLISYHFSGFSRDEQGNWYSHYPLERERELVTQTIYRPYIRAVEAESARLAARYGMAGTAMRKKLEWPLYVRFEKE